MDQRRALCFRWFQEILYPLRIDLRTGGDLARQADPAALLLQANAAGAAIPVQFLEVIGKISGKDGPLPKREARGRRPIRL